MGITWEKFTQDSSNMSKYLKDEQVFQAEGQKVKGGPASWALRASSFAVGACKDREPSQDEMLNQRET